MRYVLRIRESCSHLNLSWKENAFTMAEVLVTLGIIGVVVAMTLPGVMARHRSKVLEAQFKRRYSEVSQVLLKLQDEAEYVYGVHTAPELAKFLASNLKGSVAPSRSIYRMSKDNQERELGYSLPVYKIYTRLADIPVYLLDDGFVSVNKELFIYFNADNHVTTNMSIIIDINGLQKPNVFGYDVFTFIFDKDKILKVQKENTWNCSMQSPSTMNGWSCSYYAMSDGNYFKNLGW